MEKWFLRNKKIEFQKVIEKYKLNDFVSRILVNRGITSEEKIKYFINTNIANLRNPAKMLNLTNTVNILEKKINEKNRIRVVGDYDIDGIISTYLFVTALQRCGALVDYDIPDRIKDGYGININIIDLAIKDGIDTILTCDNGIAAMDAIKYAKKMGITVIITDHHNVPFIEDENNDRIYIKPNADIIVNPKQQECMYGFKELCGAGVVYKIVSELYKKFNINEKELLDFIELVAIATVCDVVELVDENRIIVKYGLGRLNNTKNLGIKALIKETGIAGKKLTTYHLGFILGPCINASGRLDSAKKGLSLLLAGNKDKVEEIAKELVLLNTERRKLTEEGLNKALEICETDEYKKYKVLVVYLPGINESVAGIIAGRLKEKYNKPTIVLTNSDDFAKGSARSIEEYNIFEEILKQKDLLLKFGGHPMAAGMSIEIRNIDLFRQRLNEDTSLTDEDIIKKVYIDLQVPLNVINFNLIDSIEVLEPYGTGNPKPILGAKGLYIREAKILGKDKNVLKLRLSDGNYFIEGIYFGNIKAFEEKVINIYGEEQYRKVLYGYQNDVKIDIVYYPEVNEYMGNKKIQIIIQSYRFGITTMQ